ncbi:hypothetical protein [Thomasclavelia spiroformis]|nr:hypothetical protein [Thomasclavelia spiroformis]
MKKLVHPKEEHAKILKRQLENEYFDEKTKETYLRFWIGEEK